MFSPNHVTKDSPIKGAKNDSNVSVLLLHLQKYLTQLTAPSLSKHFLPSASFTRPTPGFLVPRRPHILVSASSLLGELIQSSGFQYYPLAAESHISSASP